MSNILNSIESLSKLKYVRLIWFLGILFLCLFPTVLAVINAPIYADSGFYLSVVERINDGYLPYVDFKPGYTPFVFYLMFWLKILFSIGINYEFYLTIHFVFQFLCAFFIYKIAFLFIDRMDYSFYASALFIIASHWNDGNYFLLETPSLLWGLMSIYFALRYSKKPKMFFLVGILVVLSFLSKQYGLGFFALVFFLMLYNDNLKQFYCFFSGFLIPILICFFVFKLNFLETISGEYGLKISLKAHLFTMFEGISIFFTRIFPVLIIGLFYIPSILKRNEKSKVKNYILLLMGIFGFMLQFYFWISSHYFLYIIPFASILTFLLLSDIKRFKWLYVLFLMITISYSFYSTYYNRVYKIYYKNSDIKVSQYKMSREILKRVTPKRTMYIADIGLIPQYYLTNILPPNFKTIGYHFGSAINQNRNLEQINSADYVLKYKKEYEFCNYNCSQSRDALSKRLIIGINEDVYLYR
jgi:hypothetical protein